jgi:hypothetical protein
MELNLKDRLVIIHSVLPQFDTRENIMIKRGIATKVQLSQGENVQVIYNELGNGQANIGFKTAEAVVGAKEYEFDGIELLYMRKLVERIDANGMFSEETISTYEKILSASEGIEQSAAGGEQSAENSGQ